MTRHIAIGILCFFAGLTSAFASDGETKVFLNVDKEAQRLETLLLSPCCWGGTVAEHSSPAALEIKSELREMLRAGKKEEEILAGYEAEFGERILAKPRGWLVWILPPILLLLGGLITVFAIRRLKQPAVSEPEVAQTAQTAEEDKKYVEQIDQELYGKHP